jgi:hypothetical protein
LTIFAVAHTSNVGSDPNEVIGLITGVSSYGYYSYSYSYEYYGGKGSAKLNDMWFGSTEGDNGKGLIYYMGDSDRAFFKDDDIVDEVD